MAASWRVISASSRQTCQAHAKLGLLASDQVLSIPADLGQCIGAHHHVAAAGLGLADRRVPFGIAKPVVDRALRVALAPAAAHRGDLRMLV
jgi:hypothetical protein